MSARDAFLKLFERDDIDVSVLLESEDGERKLTIDLDQVGVWAYRDKELNADELKTTEDVERELRWLDGVQ
jgi:hypothetical protein